MSGDIVERLARVRRHLDGCRYPFGAGAVQAAISEIERLRAALRIIAGYQHCIDNLMSNVDVARAALKETGHD